jgi:hypothetical protein
MNTEWAAEKLREFVAAIDEYVRTRPPGEYLGNEDHYRRLMRLEPTAKRILKELDSDLADFRVEAMDGEYSARTAAVKGLGILADQEEVEVNLRPTGPVFAAARLHPWVWDAASTFWDAGHYRQAVEQAARAVTAHTQAKVRRRDIADDDLMAQVLTLDSPKTGAPRLRVPGHRDTPTWRSRQRGALAFAQGCYFGIRNPAVHEHELDWPEQEALEYLAAFSVLARWISECEVESYS